MNISNKKSLKIPNKVHTTMTTLQLGVSLPGHKKHKSL